MHPKEYELAVRMRLTLMPLSRKLRQQSTMRFTPTQLSVIGSIRERGPISVGQIAAEEHLSPPTISKAIAYLEEQDIVERVQDDNDRRIYHVHMTSAGEKWLEQTRTQRDDWLAEQIAGLTAREQAQLAAALPVLQRLTNADR